MAEEQNTVTNVSEVASPAEASKPEVNQGSVTDSKAAIEYKLSLPEGSKVGQGRVDEIVSYAKERGLSNEVAQDILNREHGAIAGYEASQAAALSSLRDQWISELKEDKKYGGDNFSKTVENAKRALAMFGTQELRELLNKTGWGDHKELIKTFANIGERTSDDTLLTSSINTKPAKQKTYEERIYGPQKE